ncbi:LPS export ABC transporter permease LptF [Pararhodobacter aggregans]|uniref:LPS export ABC transporter permease LptF n=1 Tax=Pararhodobacter aggregans TaxID=404875 RepID=A0A2T7UR29_9RHOB|nr:LPS export ABC transporter permease LptF [Pararhodobacter aggregans]PTX01860.1 lipopolysaccharide export system permease protein [Pararhodobacter aggregans]PVE47058.1 LPS export ABC transporter permease LptF [Pararhodobacter aggregans]
MTRLDRYILAQLLWVFGFFSLVLVSVYWVNRAVRLFDQLISDGQPMSVFLEFTALSLPMLIRTVLPISAFVAATYVTLGLLRNSEMSVLQAAGISPFRIARPVVVFGLIVTAFLTLLMHFLIPEARAELARRQVEVAQNLTASLLQDGVFQHPAEGITFFINEITEDGTMRGIYLSDARSQLQRIDYTARTALIVPEATGPKLVMIDGQAQVHDQRSGRLSVTGFGDFTYDLSSMAGPAGRGRSVQELTSSELMSPTPALLAETRASEAQFRFELVSRFVDGFAAVAAALIGFSALMAGGFSRLGFWKEIVLAVVLMALVQSLTNALAGPAMRQASLAWLGAIPLALAVAASMGLIGWATRRRRVKP